MAWMAGNVLRNVLSRPATRPYPQQPREVYPGVRGRLAFIPEKCEFCGECERVCPSNAIVLDTIWEKSGDRIETVWVRIYKPMFCVFCNRCVEECAYAAILPEEGHLAPRYVKDEEYGRVDCW